MKTDRILIVDDEELNRLLLEGIIEVLGYECRLATNGVEALHMLDEEIDLVLLDINMPELTGFDVVRQIRSSSHCSDVPVVMVTALSSMQDRLAAVEAGANDFISKPFDQTELRIRIASQLRIKHSQDEVKRHKEDLKAQVLERTWELNEANKRLESLATTDVVTGLPNHRSLVNALDAEVSRCTTAQATCAVLFIDLDYFKALNDSFGHAVGDNVLREFGEILQGALGDKGVCGRWGGEEFVCILPNSNHDDAIEIAESIRRIAAQHSFKLCMSCHLTCSIGVAIFPKDGSNQSSLAESADKAMYVAKSLGRNQVRAAQDVSSSFVSLHSDSVSREDQALTGLVEALASLVRIRDSSTGNCINDVEDLAKQIAVELKLTPSDIRLIGIAGKLHDIGKVAISDAILTKTDPLTPDEWALMKQHATIGAEVVARVPSLRAIAPGIRSHHEQWDGGGYPDGLIGAEIPLAAQIVSVADCFSAITSDRPYHQGLSGEEALAKIRQSSGSKFSPDVVSALEGVIGRSRSLSAA